MLKFQKILHVSSTVCFSLNRRLKKIVRPQLETSWYASMGYLALG